MPKAGWCRECGEWVWVDQNNACQHGHGSDCVTQLHDATPQDPASAIEPGESATLGFGVGDLPDAVYRFNWGAFFLAPIWGIVYGAWPVVTLWMLSLLAPFFVYALFGVGADASASALASAAVVSQIIVAASRLWIGANASAWVWRRESARLQFFEGTTPRFTVDVFLARQRVWALVGAALQVASVSSLAFLVFADQRIVEAAFALAGTQVTRLELGLALVWTLAEVLLGVWLASQMRKERPGTPQPAGEL